MDCSFNVLGSDNYKSAANEHVEVSGGQCNTLVSLLRSRAQCQASQQAYIFLAGEEQEESLTYSELDYQARALAAWLQMNVAPGERALLLYPPGLTFITAFFACLYAGIIAVPLYPPSIKRPSMRFQSVLRDAEASVILTTSSVLAKTGQAFAEVTQPLGVRWIATDELTRDGAEQWREPQLSDGSLAFIQYTSGSTATPKGVMLTHRNLLHNLAMIQQGFGTSSQSRGVIWLPPYHDMGLIGGILQPLYAQFPVVLMAPATFLQHPIRWLEAISCYQATMSGGPNFAYELCVRKITPEQRASLDLSSWEVAFNGAEPIRADTIEAFTALFSACGFRREAFYPCYGLAEATLIVSGGLKTEQPLIQPVQQEGLSQGVARSPVSADQKNHLLVGCGQALLHQQIVIVDPEKQVLCQPAHVGEIWVAGPGVASGYWNNPDETAHTFGARICGEPTGPFLRTGDLGFLLDGQLFVTGRHKDLLIIRGRNYYPQDIELTVERSHSALRPGSGAAFSIEVEREEKLVVVQEVERHARHLDLMEVCKCVRLAVAEEYDLQIYAIILIKTGSMPKTSSGKLQRSVCREQFLTDTLDVLVQSQLEAFDLPPEYGEAAELISRESLLERDTEHRLLVLQAYIRQVIASVLRIDPKQLSPQDSLIQVGIDSLSALELQNRIEDRLNVSVPLEMVLGDSTIAQIVAYLCEHIASADVASTLVPTVTQQKYTEYPLSYGQRALWFLYKLAPKSPAYIIARAMYVCSPMDIATLGQALQVLVERYDILRTTFTEKQGVPVQVIQMYTDICLTQIDATAWSEADLSQYVQKEALASFELEKAPPFRVHLFLRSTGRHVLLFTIHHIIADLRSLLYLFREFCTVYHALSKHAPFSLPDPQAVYGDFVVWQARLLESRSGQEHWRYWQRQLAGDLPTLALPTDFKRLSLPTYHSFSTLKRVKRTSCPEPLPMGERILLIPEKARWNYNRESEAFTLGADLTCHLRDLARNEEVTLFALLLAAFQLFLHRYTGQTDILVGTSALGRSRSEFAHVAGYFANLIVMRADLSRQGSFRALLQRTQHELTAALAHQDYPFSLLVEKLSPQREAGYHPLCQAALILENPYLEDKQDFSPLVTGQGKSSFQSGDLFLEPFPLKSFGAEFDLTLILFEEKETLHASLEYNADLFTPRTIHSMVRNFQTLLTSIVAHPDWSGVAYAFLAEEERYRLMEWSRSLETRVKTQCIHHVFERQVTRTPDAIALAYEDQQLSYFELNCRSNQIAHFMRGRGAGPEVPVGLSLKRSPDLIITLLGILKAGGSYVPLDPAYPESWRTEVIANAGLHLLVTQEEFLDLFAQTDVDIICLDRLQTLIAQEDETNPVSGVIPTNQAYILYTSGSTGKPKGVMIEHRGLFNLAWEQIQTFEVQGDSRILQFASCNFDASVSEILMALLAGATLCLGNRDSIFFGEELAHVLQMNAITTVTLPPSVLATLPSCSLSALHCIVSAGESCFTEIISRWSKGRRFFNAYGPTETTVCATITECFASDRLPPSLGKPIAGVEVYLLDAHLQLAPAGVEAEIYIGGAGIARGYLGQPERTASHFLPHPWSAVAGARIYKTGDLGRYRSDGTIEFSGRRDQQVKVRGVRVDMEGIREVLLEHTSVRDAIVVAREFVAKDISLIAYVVVDAQSQPTDEELRVFLQKRLPGYALPRAILFLPALPLTLAGKVDQRALPVPAIGSSAAQNILVAAGNDRGAALAMIWAELLAVDQVEATTNFFEIGGHSLLALQLLSRIREVFNVQLSIRSVFETPTIAGLVEKIRAAELEQTVLPALRPSLRHKDIPLSSAQLRLWFLNQLQPGCPYHVPAALRIRGPLTIAALHRSAIEVARRHEILRTTFALSAGKPVQFIAPDAIVFLPLCDLRGLAPAIQSTLVEQLAVEAALHPFDLQRGPLLRMMLLRLAEEEHVLLITIHHIIWDGWSTGTYLREVAAFYDACCTNQEISLPALPVQYADFSIWQQQWLQGKEFAEQMEYWQQQLAGLSPLNLPMDEARPSVRSYRGATQDFTIPADLTTGIKNLARQERVTLFILLLAAFQVLLHLYSGSDDVAIGSNVANRMLPEIENLLGFFVNTLVIRTDVGGNPHFRDFLKRVRDTAIEAYAHQNVPFEKIVERLGLKSSRGASPLVQVIFLLQNISMPEWKLQETSLEFMAIDPGIAKYDLVCSLEEHNGELSGQFTYSTDLFQASTIARMEEHYVALLRGIVERSDARIRTLAVFNVIERGHNMMSHDPIPGKIRFARRRSVNLDSLNPVSSHYLDESKTPLVLQPALDGVLLPDWARHNRAFLEENLLKHGALLFRGFQISTTAQFEELVLAVSEQLFKEYGDLPREQASEHIYTSTPYPADKPILFHNESSHQDRWPARIWFYCATPAQEGGATPLVDCRKIYTLLDTSIVEQFAKKQVMYVRNFIDELDVSWQQFFQTTDRSVVEAYCQRIQASCEWSEKGFLRVKQVCPAVVRHPVTGEKSFFNQIQLFHPSLLEATTRKAITSLFREDELPRNVYYGDGSRIEDSVVQKILAVYEQTAVRFAWQEGDVILLDNMLMAHGRDPYKGTRKIQVALSETISKADLL